jgi:penicillin-binding protein 1A
MAGKKARRVAAATPAPAAKDDGARASRPASARGKRGGGGGRALRRLFYWSLVLGLWAVIAAIGAVAFVVSTLPPIQSLEVPKRPPTVEIVGTDGRPLTCAAR